MGKPVGGSVYAGFELELAGVGALLARGSGMGWLKELLSTSALGLGRRVLSIWLESVASAGDSDELSVVEQAIEDGAGGRYIAEELSPFFDGSV